MLIAAFANAAVRTELLCCAELHTLIHVSRVHAQMPTLSSPGIGVLMGTGCAAPQVTLDSGCNATDASGQALAPWSSFDFTVARVGLIRCALTCSR